MPPNPLLFCNIAWMDSYQGISDIDHPQDGGRYVAEQEHAHEACNFVAHDGLVFGFVQVRNWGPIKLERLGAPSSSESLEKVDVIWTARRPGYGTVIVGWYIDATVYRTMQQFQVRPPVQEANRIEGYRIEAYAANGVLLRPDQRTFRIPRGKGGMGQANVWYASEVSDSFRSKVRQFMRGTQKSSDKARSSVPDQARKLRVEKAAIETVWRHYESQGFTIDDRQRDNVGWDLEAVRGLGRLRIEVKGRSGQDFLAELTSNEFDAFKSAKADFRLCIVTDCLAQPQLETFAFHEPSKSWRNEPTGNLEIVTTQRVSATVSAIKSGAERPLSAKPG